MHDQSGCSHVLLVLPCLDITESSEFLALKSDHGLGLLDLLGDIFRLSLRDAGAPYLGRLLYCL